MATPALASAHIRKSFNQYDRNNDDSARNWLLASVDETLRKDISELLVTGCR
jgi:hypothetical protein